MQVGVHLSWISYPPGIGNSNVLLHHAPVLVQSLIAALYDSKENQLLMAVSSAAVGKPPFILLREAVFT
jgi:hypothetical protein